MLPVTPRGKNCLDQVEGSYFKVLGTEPFFNSWPVALSRTPQFQPTRLDYSAMYRHGSPVVARFHIVKNG